MRERESKPPYLPTPFDIRKACEAIRLGWSEAEHRKRAPHLVEQAEFQIPTIQDDHHHAGAFIDD